MFLMEQEKKIHFSYLKWCSSAPKVRLPSNYHLRIILFSFIWIFMHTFPSRQMLNMEWKYSNFSIDQTEVQRGVKVSSNMPSSSSIHWNVRYCLHLDRWLTAAFAYHKNVIAQGAHCWLIVLKSVLKKSLSKSCFWFYRRTMCECLANAERNFVEN